jgi:hypothetical protein
MPRRVSLPGAGELFRSTVPAVADDASAGRSASSPPSPEGTVKAVFEGEETGRVRHDQKITVYLSTDELEALEDARIELRRQYRISVDRGRIVRAAIAEALAGLADDGADSNLVHRLN